MKSVRSEEAASYNSQLEADSLGVPPLDASSDDDIIKRALAVLKRRLREPDVAFDNCDTAINWLTIRMAEYEREVFSAIFLDNRHRLIGYEELFFGTIDGASVHSREVVKAALRHNAAAVILAHNHPSGNPEPSNADRQITRRLKDALALVDVRVLDHIVVGGIDAVSFSRQGLL